MSSSDDRKGKGKGDPNSRSVADPPELPNVSQNESTEQEAPPGSFSVPTTFEQYHAKASSLGRFRLPQDFDQVAQVKKVIVVVKAQKPNGQAFFRVHADEAYRMQVALLKLKDENEVYLVGPSLIAQLGAEVTPHTLYTYVTRQGVVGLWPARLPRNDGRTDHWMQSEHHAATRAMAQWVRMTANMAAGAFDVRVSMAELPEPEWPEMSFEQLLELAFADHIIEDMNHPVLRRLRGEM
jgi:hypothetical protein